MSFTQKPPMYNAELIKKVIYEHIPSERIEKIIIFGSRARGDAREDSDTDICVIMRDSTEQEYERVNTSNIYWSFAENELTVDLIIKSSYIYNRYKDVIGSFENDIRDDGVVI